MIYKSAIERLKGVKEKYLSQNNIAHYEINKDNIDFMNNKYSYQFYQLKIGIEKMLEYEINNSTKFNVCMKSRFDTAFTNLFYPYVPNNDVDIFSKICLDDEFKILISNKFDNSIDNLITYLKNQNIELPNCRVINENDSFGGNYFNNFISIYNIKNGSDNILYSYQDYYIWGNRDVFIKLIDFFDNYSVIETSLNIPHYYAPEAQLLLFCFFWYSTNNVCI